MKITKALIALLITAGLTGISCKKDNDDPSPAPGPARTVKFILYSNTDLSSDKGTITFTLHIGTPGHTIWDSVLAPMNIKDVPSLTKELVFQKIVPGNNNADLQVGFLYTITDVGNSWFLDIFKAGETQKTIEYDFK
ncbi:MAG TPA: hypothetical protein VK563_11245 [Puia sp.]|nr:hypothetical protein [Puia sp.]